MMLAQEQLAGLPAGFWKSFTIAGLVLLGTVALLVGIILGLLSYFKKPEPTKIDDEPALNVRVKPPRLNHALVEERHGEVTRRLDSHDAELEQIWTTMRSEDAAIRRENGIKFDAILLSLGEIKGELKNKP